MAALVPVKGEAGVFMLGEKKIRIQEWREDWRWDTVQVFGTGGAAIMVAGQNWTFFRDLTNKNDIDTNISQQRRISRGEEMVINSFGLFVGGRVSGAAGLVTNEVFHFLCERLYFQFKINKDIVGEGPVMCFQPGVGVAGTDAVGGTPVLNNGVPSLSTIRPLLVHQEITSEHDLDAKLEAQDAQWLVAGAAYVFTTIAQANAVLVKLMLNGYIKKALGRG